MPRWTKYDFDAYVSRRANSLRSGREIAKLESDPSNGNLGTVQVQEPATRSFLVVVTSFRRRLLDEDNLCEKYHVDCCRYAGLLPGDEPSQTQIQVRQEKVGSKEREFVRIEIHQVTTKQHDDPRGNPSRNQAGSSQDNPTTGADNPRDPT